MIEASAAPHHCRRALGHSLRLAEAEAQAPERAELEAFVREGFSRKHEATVASFMPTLLSFRDTGGDLRGVIGLRGAVPSTLYLEQYLEQPVEAAIAAATGQPVRRRQVVEVSLPASACCAPTLWQDTQLKPPSTSVNRRPVAASCASTFGGGADSAR